MYESEKTSAERADEKVFVRDVRDDFTGSDPEDSIFASSPELQCRDGICEILWKPARAS